MRSRSIEYVAQGVAAGMKAIAICDHNTGDWIDRINTAAVGLPLTIFLGVEISVQPGIHILAIFPEDRTSGHVNDMLARLGVGYDSRGEQEALVTKYGPQEVVSMIRDEGALPILAHIDDHKGAWKELRESGQTLVQLWDTAEFAAVEIVGDELPEEIGEPPFTHRPAYYWSSDNPHPDDFTKHSHLGIGSRCSYFKLDEPITWEGLRLCFHDPAARIRPFTAEFAAQASQNAHPVIERVRVQGGFLKNLDLELNPNLNCIIGGRLGSGEQLMLLRHHAASKELFRQDKGMPHGKIALPLLFISSIFPEEIRMFQAEKSK